MVKYKVNFNAVLLYAQEICSQIILIPRHFFSGRNIFQS